jgi:hypothetical protein
MAKKNYHIYICKYYGGTNGETRFRLKIKVGILRWKLEVGRMINNIDDYLIF